MRVQAGDTILLTGASGGLGEFIARAFARFQVRLVLVDFPAAGLDAVRQAVQTAGSEAVELSFDLRQPHQRVALVEEVQRRFGRIDVLVNNAGVEFTSPYHDLSEAQVQDVIDVNLAAPMMLTRLCLPGMLKRGSGHIVSISSLAGKSGPALQEPYAATKAALVAFTLSLRASYRSSGVSASTVVPGFVDAGIYARLKRRSGCRAPALLTGCSGRDVAEAVLKAIQKDIPEIIVNRYPIRLALALSALSPRLGEWITARIGVHDFFRRVYRANRRGEG